MDVEKTITKSEGQMKEKEEEHPDLSLSVVTLSHPSIYNNYAKGYGDKAHETLIHGKVVNLQILKDGKAQIGIYIKEDGTLVITDYAGMCFKSDMPRNFHLEPASGWKKEEKT